MGMENFRHRRAARIVAFIDTVLTCIGIILLLVFFGLSVYATIEVAEITKKSDSSENHDDADVARAVLSIFIVVLWIVMIVNFIIACVELWAAIMLLKATKHGADVSKAIRRALIWRNVMVVLLTIGVVASLISGEWFRLVVEIIIRAPMLYFVVKFIKEMEEFVLSGGSRLPSYDNNMI